MRNRLNEEINKLKGIMNIINEGASNNIDFNKMVGIVIDKLEGGYYHPDMLKDGRVKSSLYNASGETMFGIDRLKGGSINNTTVGREFWNIIDSANARKNWSWNYKGGNLGNKLKTLVAEMMRPQYDSYTKSYLSNESQRIINSNESLAFNFVYATWNGPGWFKTFATKFNRDVENGITNIGQLIYNVIKYRKESSNQIIINTGNRMETFIKGVNKMSGGITSNSATDLSQSSAIDKNAFNTYNLTSLGSDFKTYDLNRK